MRIIRRMKGLLPILLLGLLFGCGTGATKKPVVVDLEGSPIVSPGGSNENGQGSNMDSVNRQLSFQEATEYAALVLELDFSQAENLYEEHSEEKFREVDGVLWPESSTYRIDSIRDGMEEVVFYNENDLPIWNETSGIRYVYLDNGSLAYQVESEQPTFYATIELQDHSIVLSAFRTLDGRLSFTIHVNDEDGFRVKDVYCKDVNYEQFQKVFGEGESDSYVSAGVCIYETEYLWTENGDESNTVSIVENDGATYRRSYDSEGRLLEQVVLTVENGETRQDIERYDQKENLVSEEHFLGDQLEESIQYSNHYDENQKLVQVEIFEDETLRDTITYRYEYNDDKRLIRFIVINEEGEILQEENTFYLSE